MIAVIQTGGKQYLLKQGDILKVEKLAAQPGEQVSFDVLLTAEGTDVKIGTPKLAAKVKAEVLEQGRNKTIEVVKYKAKSRYTRRVGHRQMFTKIKIVSIA